MCAGSSQAIKLKALNPPPSGCLEVAKRLPMIWSWRLEPFQSRGGGCGVLWMESLGLTATHVGGGGNKRHCIALALPSVR